MRRLAYDLALLTALAFARTSGLLNGEMQAWDEPRLSEVPWRAFVWLLYVPVRACLSVHVWVASALDPTGNFRLVATALRAEGRP